MKGYVYNVDSSEIVVVINGAGNDDIEAKATDLNYLGEDEYGLSYSDHGLTETEHTEHVDSDLKKA